MTARREDAGSTEGHPAPMVAAALRASVLN